MIYKRLFDYYRPYLNRFVFAMICMILSSLIIAGSRLLLKPLIDDVFINKKTTILYLIIIGIVISYFILGILSYAKNYLMTYIAQQIIMNIRSNMYHRLQYLSLDFYSKGTTGEIMSRVTNDVSLLQNVLTRAPAVIICDGLTIICLIFLLFYLRWNLAIICITIFIFCAIPLNIFSKRMRNLSLISQQRIADLYSHLQESLTAINITKAFNREATEIERFNKTNKDFYKIMMSFTRIDARSSPIIEFIGALVVAIVVYFAANDVVKGNWTTGSFFTFIGIAFSIYPPLKNIIQLNPQIQQSISAIERIFNLLDTKTQVIELPGAYKIKSFENEIKYENVTFEYKSGHKVLKNINLNIKLDEVIGIVGPSGCGKTTLAHLLLRFYDPTEGAIYIDGHNLKEVELKSLREQIGIVTQETILFNESIKYNIAYGKENATDEEIINAAIAADAHDFIMKKLSNKYDTIIGERGVILSGGEKQRIAIARAIIRNPKILILDEATSSLDAESEKTIQETLEKLIKGKTVLMIAHRLSTVKKCNRIVVIDEGCIVDIGTHDELLQKEGIYKRLHNLQLI